MTDIENVLREMRDFANGDWAKERGIGKDLNQWAEAIEATMREKDAEIESLKKHAINLRLDADECALENERLHEQVQDMIDISGQECGCGYDKPDDVCLGHWSAYKKQLDEIERLREALHLMLEIAPRGLLNAKEELALKAAYAALAGKEVKP